MQVVLGAEEHHRGAAIRHGVRDGRLVGAVVRPRRVAQQVLEDVAGLDDARIAPSLLRMWIGLPFGATTSV